MATPMSSADRKAPPRLRSRITRIGSSGCDDRTSITTNATSSAAAATRYATVIGASQPSVLALVKP
jgi:hypothetical protein